MTENPMTLVKEDAYLYIMMRTDLPSMGLGKSVAQGAHAANQFTEEHVIQPLLKGKEVDSLVTAWRTATPDGFGTTISLGVAGDQMRSVVHAAQKLKFMAAITVDPTFPYLVDKEIFPLIGPDIHTEKPVFLKDAVVCFRREESCAYVFGLKSQLQILLGQFNLLNND
jgi:peptidyl-tRNA hydrolase